MDTGAQVAKKKPGPKPQGLEPYTTVLKPQHIIKIRALRDRWYLPSEASALRRIIEQFVDK